MRFPVGVIGVGSVSFSELATIDEGLQNVLLHVQVIVIVDRREGIAGEPEILIFDRFCSRRNR